MNILIIGSEGFIGNNLVEHLSKTNNCYCADVIPFNKISQEKLKKNNIVYSQLNKINPDYNELIKNTIKNAEKLDVCINASGSASVSLSLQNPLFDSVLNYLNVEKILEAIRQNDINIRFITLSSAAVYGNPDLLPIKETTRLRPLSPYGFHKVYAENACKMYNELYGINTYVLRLFSIYGIGQKKLLLWELINKFIKNNVVELFGTGREGRDYINIKDIINAISIFVYGCDADGKEIVHGAYNIANGVQIYISRIAEIVKELLCSEKAIIFNGQTKKGDPNNWEADVTKLKLLGYKQTVPINQGLREYIDWAKKQLIF